MSVQFDRQYRFSAGAAGGAGFEIGEADPGRMGEQDAQRPTSPVGLHIYFNVQKVDASTANTSKITLRNLNQSHLAALNEKDCVVTLWAGYGSAMPLVFVGTITHIETTDDGADRMTEMEAVDGKVVLRDTYVSLSYKGAANTQKIMQDTAGQMGVAVTFSYNAEFSDYPDGFSFIGPAKRCSTRLAPPPGLYGKFKTAYFK